jgi:uncharacterized protein
MRKYIWKDRGFIAGIQVYQHYISPLKTYRCAHAYLHGGLSCSAWGVNMVKRRGWRAFMRLLKLRLQRCEMAQAQTQKQNDEELDKAMQKTCGRGCGHCAGSLPW